MNLILQLRCTNFGVVVEEFKGAAYFEVVEEVSSENSSGLTGMKMVNKK